MKVQIKGGRTAVRAHKAVEKILEGTPAPYSRITGKSLCMLSWIDGYQAAMRDVKRDMAKAKKQTKSPAAVDDSFIAAHAKGGEAIRRWLGGSPWEK